MAFLGNGDCFEVNIEYSRGEHIYGEEQFTPVTVTDNGKPFYKKLKEDSRG